ncbi:hypothetical protein FHS39_001487 [Streptomyces olivoverticillatus]|uniref:Uncharacterized protein n=1 Tax=Streptomyces olivoverticillatus TaxID=66427 RepID=A0A7W7PIV6_9ACTN|nr:hypothetical protein [Streptomyces olivoverticillatus]MBB4892476.1 hypothetical protein [Streptomyces olivoverticillatus]
MNGSGDPPEGTPEGGQGGGDEEYRSVVFDESFVRAARLQEFSARERMDDHAPAVRTRHAWARVSASRQVLLLVILIALAFGTAVYMGLRHPYKDPRPPTAEALRIALVPLAPRDPVPGGTPQDLFGHSPAAQFRDGAEGVNLPAARRTQNFSESLVMAALATAKEYTVKSALDPAALAGGSPRGVRLLLAPAQLGQFDSSFDHPAGDGRHAATGWLIRFDAAQAALTEGAPIRTQGTFSVSEVSPAALEVLSDHIFVYALHPVKAGDTRTAQSDQSSLFTVRRTMRFRFDRDDLQEHHVQVLQSSLQAGPESCSADASGYLRPLLAGQTASGSGPAGTDPYATAAPTAALCGTLAPGAEPSPPHR